MQFQKNNTLTKLTFKVGFLFYSKGDNQMKNFLGINWKIRTLNPTGVAQMIVAIFLPVLIYLGIDWQTLTSWSAVGKTVLDILSNPIAVVLILINFYNSVIDGTSAGLTDSPQALNYHRPNKD
jgi:phi LC3 family holin